MFCSKAGNAVTAAPLIGMRIYRRWPEDGGVPDDNGFVVVVLHRGDRATLIVVPSSASGRPIPDIEVTMPEGLDEAERQAAAHGLATIYIAPNDAAPWDPAWGDLQ